MNVLTQSAQANLEVPVMNMPIYILVPIVIVIGIAAVAGVRWIYDKRNKKNGH